VTPTAYDPGSELVLGLGLNFTPLVGIFVEFHDISLDCTDVRCGDDVVFDTGGTSVGLMLTPWSRDRVGVWLKAGIMAYHAEQSGLTADGRDNSFKLSYADLGFRITGGLSLALAPGFAVIGSIGYNSDVTVLRDGPVAPRAPPFGEPGRQRGFAAWAVALQSTVLSLGVRLGPFGS